MKLQATDLINYSKFMGTDTGGKYEIIPTKHGQFRTLEIKNNENQKSERLWGCLTTREAYEMLRGIYAAYRFFNS